MITIISATNRPNNLTMIFAKKYFQLLKNREIEVQLFSLEEMSANFNLKNIYDYHHPEIIKLITKYISPADKIVFVVPEYNSGIPGVFKVFIDAVKPVFWENKKIAMVGVSSGKSGNLRGIDTMTNMFHYLKSEVLPFKVPISQIHTIIDKDRNIIDEGTIKTIELQIEKFLKF